MYFRQAIAVWPTLHGDAGSEYLVRPMSDRKQEPQTHPPLPSSASEILLESDNQTISGRKRLLVSAPIADEHFFSLELQHVILTSLHKQAPQV